VEKRLRLGAVDPFSFLESDGICYSIYFQGCLRRCKGCHNPELWDLDGGELVAADDILKDIKKKENWYTAVAFLGGEPLLQQEALLYLMRGVKEMGLETWLYTGCNSVSEIPQEILTLADVIKLGEYREDLRDTGYILASTNQYYIDRRGVNAAN